MRASLLCVLLALFIAVFSHSASADLNNVAIEDVKIDHPSKPFRDENGQMVQRVREVVTMREDNPDGSSTVSRKQIFPLIPFLIKGAVVAAKAVKAVKVGVAAGKAAVAAAKASKVGKAVSTGIKIAKNVKKGYDNVKRVVDMGKKIHANHQANNQRKGHKPRGLRRLRSE
ncbi:Aste57867_20187 [Aphanomyces stellatus]|uniref:Aste57867_20187 protein n=1 Tax=Aphanomyces stellatus TaxID=120398 RepID=A0A485LEE6_9STRA|nr:hypothetical protein As57867_020121 [Aphanomyces stellatus]VFT96881.1 Aste57867_20187 [Aphanomyces stellatus]